MEGVQPLEENVEHTPRPRFERSKLLLVASVIQGLGLLLCLTYVCQHFRASQVSDSLLQTQYLHPISCVFLLGVFNTLGDIIGYIYKKTDGKVSLQLAPIESIQARLQTLSPHGCENNFIITLLKTYGNMEVQNKSVTIRCDGFYLISLKGYFSQEVNINLHYRKGAEPFPILKKSKFANSNVVLRLGYKDKVYLNVTTDSNSCKQLNVNAGELFVIHQNPGGYCAP